MAVTQQLSFDPISAQQVEHFRFAFFLSPSQPPFLFISFSSESRCFSFYSVVVVVIVLVLLVIAQGNVTFMAICLDFMKRKCAHVQRNMRKSFRWDTNRTQATKRRKRDGIYIKNVKTMTYTRTN